MAHRTLLRRRPGGGAGGRHAHRPDRRSGDRHGPRRQPRLGAAIRPAARSFRRCAARHLQSARPGLGPHRLLAAGAGRARLRAVSRDPARRLAPCRRRAHRPHHGPDAALARSARRAGIRGRLPRLSGGRSAAPAGAGIASPWRRRDRRGSRHGAARLSRPPAPRRHRRHGRAVVRARRGSPSRSRRAGAAMRSP